VRCLKKKKKRTIKKNGRIRLGRNENSREWEENRPLGGGQEVWGRKMSLYLKVRKREEKDVERGAVFGGKLISWGGGDQPRDGGWSELYDKPIKLATFHTSRS